MNINAIFDFELHYGQSKKGHDYYGIYMVSKDKKVNKLITFLTKAEYENIKLLLEKK